MIFFRGNFEQFWLTLKSNEALGLLDTDFIEDYFGIDGQVTLHHLSTSHRHPMLMSRSEPNTFLGVLPVDRLLDGKYQVEGRVRDELNNYTILSSFEQPRGFERILPLRFEIIAGQGVLVDFGPLEFMGGYEFQLSSTEPELHTPMLPEFVLDANGQHPVIATDFIEGGEIRIEFDRELTDG